MSRNPFARLGLAAVAGVLALGALAAPAAAAERGTISGTFTTDSGIPIAGASVYAYTADDNDYLADATTDDDGRYTLRNVRATDVKVQFYDAGIEQWAHRQPDFDSATTFTLAAGQTLTVDERRLPTGTITGLLTEPSGEPAAWVSVNAVRQDVWGSVYSYTGEDGRFSMAVLPGEYTVSFLRDATEQWAYGKADAESADTFTVAAGQTVVVDDRLLPTGTLGGTLSGPDGGPLAEAEVTLYRGDSYVTGTMTDADGRYTFANVLPGGYQVGFRVGDGPTQYIRGTANPAEAATFTVVAGEHTVADDALMRVSTVQGRLTDSAGAAVAGHVVEVALDDESGQVRYETSTDDDGAWSVSGVFPGSYVVAFTRPDYSRRQYAYGKGTHAAAERIQVGPGTMVTVDDTWVDGATLTVTATDAQTGAPVSDFCVNVWNIDGNGCTTGTEVTLEDLPEGTFGLSVTPGEKSFYPYAEGGTVTLTPGRTTAVSVPLTQGGKVTAVITDRATGAPVRGACIDLKVLGRGGLGDNHGIKCSNANGRLTTPAVASGTYEMFVYGTDGYGHQWAGETGGTGDQRAAARIKVKPGKVTRTPDVRLDPAGTITGTVTDADGRPLEHAYVSYSSWSSGAGPSHGATTDAHGRWTLDELGPYAWPLLFSHRSAIWSGGVGNRFDAEPVPVTSGSTTTYDTVLTTSSRLTGAVTGVAGAGTYWRIEAVNAATGDEVGVADGRLGEPYTIPLAGAQQVKLRWHQYGESSFSSGWYDGVGDQDSATKVWVPRSGTKTLDVAIG